MGTELFVYISMNCLQVAMEVRTCID